MHTYSVPIVKHDMRHEETILDAINAFQYLNQVIEDVFEKINTRIEQNRTRLEALDVRVDKVNTDVRRLHETKEAIIIYSPSRYPASDMDSALEPTFTASNGIDFPECTYRLKDKPYIPSHTLQEKIQFYHVKSSRETERIFTFDRTKHTGGNVTRSCQIGTYLDTLLLFNETVFVQDYKCEYWKKSGHKNSSHGSTIREEKILSSSSPIIRHRVKKKSQDIFYTPSLSDAPKLDVPIDLPDLPGIVSNINYVGNSTLIAPSLQLAGIIEQLPSLEDLTSAIDVADHSKAKDNKNPNQSSLPVQSTTASNVTAPSAHPPPPPPPPLPPPPPPPPPAQLVSTAPVAGPNTKPESANTTRVKSPMASDGEKKSGNELRARSATGDAHFNLMEAIRQAGGAGKANLRHSSDPTVPKRESDSKAGGVRGATNEPKSLIDDLHNKLQMRRKGISGTRDTQEPSNVIDRLSALIPPPPARVTADASASESNEEEDWE